MFETKTSREFAFFSEQGNLIQDLYIECCYF